ncbi:MAG: 4-alpha-glucanotransferase [Lachnospiraceae bacterium]|nr:4-alpha-glucanotransferase [Lachnospiraceae bacterium]
MSKHLNRGAGILLPVSSLPSPYGIGTMGKAACEFIDKLVQAGQKYWQVLPVGPTSYGDSPYQSFSAFAGNPYFIDLEGLVEEKLLEKDEVDKICWFTTNEYIEYDILYQKRYPVLRKAYQNWRKKGKSREYYKFEEDNSFWLEDYALFMSCKEHFDQKPWTEWEHGIRNRESEAVEEYRRKLEKEMEFWKFLQYRFYQEWGSLKQYAHDKGIQIIGDIPIYVAFDSADVWVHPQLFQLDQERRPIDVAGCPPDAFAEDGQKWGNPLYDWNEMEKDGFGWWKRRIQASASLYDVIRIDHFIGITRYFCIPADKTGKEGYFAYGPGGTFTKAINSVLGDAKIIAEDLGVDYPAVEELLRKEDYPGMKVLLFAFDGSSDNKYLPHHAERNSVMYLGTHDNDTAKGFLETLDDWHRDYVKEYISAATDEDMVKQMIKTAYLSVSDTVIIQMQDVLEKDNSARMNLPSTLGTNWKWRLTEDEFDDEKISFLRKLVQLSGR